MPNKPENNRINQQTHRDRMMNQGFVRRCFWIKPKDQQQIRAFIESLSENQTV